MFFFLLLRLKNTSMYQLTTFKSFFWSMEDKASFFWRKGKAYTPAHKVTPFSCFQKLIVVVVVREHAHTEKNTNIF